MTIKTWRLPLSRRVEPRQSRSFEARVFARTSDEAAASRRELPRDQGVMPHMAQHRSYRSNESQVKLHEGKDGRSRAAASRCHDLQSHSWDRERVRSDDLGLWTRQFPRR
jgi:hypothetical protein